MEAVTTVLAVVATLLLPGIAFALAGWPVAGRWLLGGAPAVSILTLSWAGWITGRFGSTPSALVALALATALGALVGLAVRRLPRGRATAQVPGQVSRAGAALTGMAVAAVVGYRLWAGTAHWYDGVPNYWDGTWHGYLMSLVQRTGIIDAQQLVPLDPQVAGWTDYYPAGWHIQVGVALGLSDGNVLLGYNLSQLLFAAVVLPAGTLALVRALAVRSRVALVLAPVAVVLAFPVQAHLVDTPAYQVALALAPVCLAAAITASRSRWQRGPTVVAAMITAGVFLVQPAVVVVVGILLVCYLGAAVAGGAPGALRRGGLGLLAWIVMTAALSLPWVVLAATHAEATLTYARPLTSTYPHALYELLFSYHGADAGWPLAVVLAISAAVLLIRRTHRWTLVALLVFGVLYVVARAEHTDLRQTLTGLWFTDWFRLGSVFWLLAVLIGLLALAALLRELRFASRSPLRVAAGGALAVAVVLTAIAIPHWAQATTSRIHIAAREPVLVTAADRQAFEFLAQHHILGERVLNDWPDGSGWLYALEGVDPLMVYDRSRSDPERAYLLAHFAELNTNPRVDALLTKFDIRYVYTDTTRIRTAVYDLVLPIDKHRLKIVFQGQDVRVYQILSPVHAESTH